MAQKVLFEEPVDEPVDDILLEGLTHKVMVFFHLPEKLSFWGMVALWATLASSGSLLWWLTLTPGVGLAIGALLLAFFMADAVILAMLPRQQISFGPWKAQSFFLATPRVLGAMVLVLPTLWFGLTLGLGLLVVVQAAGTGLLLYGTIVEPHRLQLTDITVTTDRLAPGSDPIRLLHISDIHVERFTRRETKVLRLAKEARPDLIVITGDYVNLSYNQDPTTAVQVRHFLQQLSAPYGVYGVLGSPPVDLRETVVPIFDGLDIPLLRYGWEAVNLGNGRKLVLLGMDCTHHLPTDRRRVAQLHQTAPNKVPQVFLYHSPELMPEISARGVDLYLCGHTHGGQVRLPVLGPILTSSQLGRRYVMGLYKENRTHLYVSRGVGLEGLSAPRVRLLAPPEITLVTIKAAE